MHPWKNCMGTKLCTQKFLFFLSSLSVRIHFRAATTAPRRRTASAPPTPASTAPRADSTTEGRRSPANRPAWGCWPGQMSSLRISRGRGSRSTRPTGRARLRYCEWGLFIYSYAYKVYRSFSMTLPSAVYVCNRYRIVFVIQLNGNCCTCVDFEIVQYSI